MNQDDGIFSFLICLEVCSLLTRREFGLNNHCACISYFYNVSFNLVHYEFNELILITFNTASQDVCPVKNRKPNMLLRRPCLSWLVF